MANATAQRCFTHRAPLSGPPLIQNGHLVLQPHDIGWIISGIFTIVATAISFWLINKHLMWYTKKWQQRYIVRLLLMVPIYAIVSLASYIFWNHAIPITLLRDSYESFVLYSFFCLLLQYLSPTIEGQKEAFRNLVLKKWIFPLGSVKYRPRDGLYFLQLMKWGVLQYCVVRPTTTLAAVILDFIGLYCDSSWSPGWGHIYITIVVSLSVTIAMSCLIQLYVPIAEHLAPQKPLLKLFAVKAVVFLTFWQATVLSAFSMFGVVNDTPYMTANDINTGIAAILETFEMMCFAVLHIRAFSYIPYRPETSAGQTPRLRSLMHALDIRDMWREFWNGSVYMGNIIRGVEVDNEARRKTHFAKVMGREREFRGPREGVKESWHISKYVHDEESLIDRHAREGNSRRVDVWLNETGATLEVEVQRMHRTRELDGEGILNEAVFDEVNQGHTRGNHSWWKGIYDRIAQSGLDNEREKRLSPIPQRPLQQHRRNRSCHSRVPSLDSPPPPPSVMYEYSSLENGHSSVRLSSSHEEQLMGIPSHSLDPLVGHNHHSRAGHNSMEDLTFPVRERNLVAPRPLLIPDSHLIESLVSQKQTQFSVVPAPQNYQERNIYTSSGITRSDSLLARIFPNSTPATVEEHMSSRGRNDSMSSQTHTSPITPTVSLRLPLKHVSSRRPRNPQKQSPVRPRFPRPLIVLPAPLSPARYSAVEVPPRVPDQFSPSSVDRHSSRELRRASRNNASPQELSRFTGATSPRLGRLNPVQSDKRGTVATPRRSDHIESTSPGEPLAITQLSAPSLDLVTTSDIMLARTKKFQTQFSPISHMVTDDVAPYQNMRSELPNLPLSVRTIPISTTLPSSPISPRRLRHTRGDVGAGRKLWS